MVKQAEKCSIIYKGQEVENIKAMLTPILIKHICTRAPKS